MQAHRPSILVAMLMALAFIPVSSASAQIGTPLTLIFGDTSGTAIQLAPQTFTNLTINGTSSATLALAGSLATAQHYSPIGIVGLDFLHQSFSIWIDGFDSSSAWFVYGQLDTNGSLSLLMYPFTSTTLFGTRLYSQCVATDPTAPLGLVISNVVEAECAPPEPSIDSLSPTILAHGGQLTIFGEYLGGFANLGNPPLVTIDGEPLTVLSHTDDIVEVMVPASARSGHIEITTFGGTNTVIPDSLNAFVIVGGTPISEQNAEAGPLVPPATILGSIDFLSDVDVYAIALVAGDEVRLELLNFNATTLSTFAYPAVQYGQFLDPRIGVFHPNVPGEAFQGDDNSGPGFSAMFGHPNTPRFIAPATAVYAFHVSAAFAFTAGPYVLNVRSAAPSTLPNPTILRLEPNIAAPGTDIAMYAWGVNLNTPAAHTVIFATPTGDVYVTPVINSQGLLSATVPSTAKSSNIRLIGPTGLISPVNADDFGSYVMVPGSLMLEDPAPTPQTIYAQTTIWGSISTNFETDTFAMALNVGDIVRVRALAYDPISDRFLRGALFSNMTIDPEITIIGQSGVTITTEAHSGPAYSAEIGGLLRPPFIAPSTGNYIFGVRGWFFLSMGVYIFDIRVNE